MFCAFGFVKVLLRASSSLKEKRATIKGILNKTRREFNVSIAEVGYQELWQVSLFGFAFVGTDRVLLERKMSKLLACIEEFSEVEVVGNKEEVQKISFDELPYNFIMGKYDVQED